MNWYKLFCLFALLGLSCKGTEGQFAYLKQDLTDITIHSLNSKVVISWENGTPKCLTRAVAPNKAQNLKEIVSQLTIDYPLPEQDRANFSMQRFESDGIQLILHKGKKEVRNFFLLFTDSTNCYAVQKGFNQVYKVHLPGQDIYWADYLSSNADFWYNQLLFSYPPENLLEISVINYEQLNASWRLNRDPNWTLFNAEQNKITTDSITLERYLTYFNQVYFDQYIDLKPLITAATPLLYQLIIRTTNETRSFLIYGIPTKQKNDYGNDLVYDRDYFYLKQEDSEVGYRVKWIQFDLLLRNWAQL